MNFGLKRAGATNGETSGLGEGYLSGPFSASERDVMQKGILCASFGLLICYLLVLSPIVPARPKAQITGDMPEIVRAVYAQDHTALKRLLDAKADPDAEFHFYVNQPPPMKEMRSIRNQNGDFVRIARPEELFLTPLRIAAMNSDPDAVKLLLDAGAKVDKCDVMGGTPLVEIQANGAPPPMDASNIQVIRLLLERSANPNALSSTFCPTPLIMSMTHGVKAIRLLIDHGAEVNRVALNGETPLMRAISYKRDDTLAEVQFLVEHGANILAKDKTSGTLLMYACSHRPKVFLSFIRSLIDAGIDVNARSDSGDTALQNAVSSCDGQDLSLIAYLLQKGANPNTQDSEGNSPISLAVDYKNVNRLQLLLRHGARPDVSDSNGSTPLLAEVAVNNADAVTLLVNAGANVNIGDKNGATPLLWACSKGNPEIVRLLLAHGADVTVPTRDGRTALHIARAQNHPKIVRLLLQAGAKH